MRGSLHPKVCREPLREYVPYDAWIDATIMSP